MYLVGQLDYFGPFVFGFVLIDRIGGDLPAILATEIHQPAAEAVSRFVTLQG